MRKNVQITEVAGLTSITSWRLYLMSMKTNVKPKVMVISGEEDMAKSIKNVLLGYQSQTANKHHGQESITLVMAERGYH